MKSILVIGGGIYQTTLIKRIRELGYNAYCVDKNANCYGRKAATVFKQIDTSDTELCLAYAKEVGIDGVGTYGATITLPAVSYIGERLGLPTLSSYTAMIAGNKYRIKQALVEHGCNNKGVLLCFHSVDEALDSEVEFPCVVKPSDGSGSRGVSIVKDTNQYEQAIRYGFASARFNEVYIEGAIYGDEYSVEAFVNEGKVYIYSIIKTTFVRYGERNTDISYGHTTPPHISIAHEQTIKREVVKAIHILGINMGSVNFDIILSYEDSLAYIVDCGIRVGQNLIASHMVPLSRGVNELDMYIDQMLGNTINAEPKFTKYISTRLLIAEPGIIKSIDSLKEYVGTEGIVDIVLRKHAGDEQRVYKDKSDNIGWVICSGDSPEDAEEKAESARIRLIPRIIIG